MFSRTLYVHHPLSLRIFPSLPGSCLRLFIAMQIQHSYEHTFFVHALCAEPFARNCSSTERECLSICTAGMLSKSSILCPLGSSHLSLVLAYGFSSRCNFSTPTSTHNLYSSRLYAQNPVFRFVHQQSGGRSIYASNVQRESSVEPSMRSILCH